MDKAADCCITHLIEMDGSFNVDGLDNFIKQVKLEEYGLSYAIVAIMGPQSSGKSTLLNHLFHTNFIEMDAYKGRRQTTEGVWMARCSGIEPCTIVMDIEGTDGEERGENDTAFEKQSALFAIAVSDIVIINMWCRDIGREQAANKPLLKIVFQVMLQLFNPRKTTLMFAVRDKTKTPPEFLESKLRKDIEMIWDSFPKPEAHKGTHMNKFFNVEFVFLSSYEYEEELFKDEVASLRQKFLQSIAPGILAGDRRGVVPASGFSFKVKDIWKLIKENKDLDLPSHTIMVATMVCEKNVEEKYSSFVANYKDWPESGEDVKSHTKKLGSLLDNCLSNYDEAVKYFDASVGSAKRKQLEEKLMQHVQPTYKLMFEHIRSKELDNFKRALNNGLNVGHGFAAAARDCTEKSMGRFNELCEDATSKQANWDSTKIRDELSHDLDLHITELRAARLNELTTLSESNLKEALCSYVEALLEGGSDDPWPAIRVHLHDETETVVSRFSFALSSFEMEDQEKEDMITQLKNYARRLVEEKAKIEDGNVLRRMKDRFTDIFNQHNNSMPPWTGNEDIPAIAKTAWTSSLKLLSVFAVIRLDEDKTDTIWEMLVLSLVERMTYTTTSHDPLASRKWEKIPATDTLITPIRCKSLWDQFQRETETIIKNAHASQEAYKRHNNKLAYLAMFGKNLGFGVVWGILAAQGHRFRRLP